MKQQGKGKECIQTNIYVKSAGKYVEGPGSSKVIKYSLYKQLLPRCESQPHQFL